MKTLLALLLAATAVAGTITEPPWVGVTVLAAKWKKRVLILTAPLETNTAFQRQKQLLAAAPTGLAERDILVLDIPYNHLAPADKAFLQQQLHLKLSGFEVALIGKDGGVKQRSAHPLTPEVLFGTIDKMPMRRQEMRRGQ